MTMVRRLLQVLVVATLVACVAVPGVAADKVKINLWFAGNPKPMMDAVDSKLIPDFEAANPDIDLEVTYVPWGDLSTKLATSFAGGVAPDVFMHGQAATAGFASAEQVEPLDSYIATMSDAADFGVTLDAGVYFGKRYMMPIFGSGWLLMYRADQFKEVGLDPNKPPTTWEELRDAAKKLTIWQGGRLVREGLDLPSTGVNPPQIWACLLWQNGGDFFNEDFTKCTFNSPEGVEALQFIVDLIHKDKTTDTSINMGQGNIPAIATGEVAMLFAVPGDCAAVKTYAPDVYKEVRIAPPLVRKKQVALYAFNGFFMSKSSKHKPEAWRTIQYFSSPKAIEVICGALRSLPPRQSLASMGFIAEDPNLKTFVKGMNSARGNPNIPQWVKIRDVLSRYIEKAMYGAMTPKEALDAAAKEGDEILKK